MDILGIKVSGAMNANADMEIIEYHIRTNTEFLILSTHSNKGITTTIISQDELDNIVLFLWDGNNRASNYDSYIQDTPMDVSKMIKQDPGLLTGIIEHIYEGIYNHQVLYDTRFLMSYLSMELQHKIIDMSGRVDREVCRMSNDIYNHHRLSVVT